VSARPWTPSRGRPPANPPAHRPAHWHIAATTRSRRRGGEKGKWYDGERRRTDIVRFDPPATAPRMRVALARVTAAVTADWRRRAATGITRSATVAGGWVMPRVRGQHTSAVAAVERAASGRAAYPWPFVLPASRCRRRIQARRLPRRQPPPLLASPGDSGSGRRAASDERLVECGFPHGEGTTHRRRVGEDARRMPAPSPTCRFMERAGVGAPAAGGGCVRPTAPLADGRR